MDGRDGHQGIMWVGCMGKDKIGRGWKMVAKRSIMGLSMGSRAE